MIKNLTISAKKLSRTTIVSGYRITLLCCVLFCRILYFVMLNVITLNVIMLSVVAPNVYKF